MGVRLVSNKLGNIPSRVCIAQHCRTPGGSHPETWYYKELTLARRRIARRPLTLGLMLACSPTSSSASSSPW